MKDDVPDEVKRRRVERIMERQKAISLDNNLRRVGRTERVVVDARQGDYYVCRTQYDSPEVDQELLIPADGRRLRRGCFYEARITAAEEYDLYGELTNGETVVQRAFRSGRRFRPSCRPKNIFGRSFVFP